MGANQLHWLDIAEYIALGITVLSIIVAVVVNAPIYALIALTITLLLNAINRLRFQYRYKKRLTVAVQQLKIQFAEELAALAAKISPVPSKIAQQSPPIPLSVFQESLVSLEQSLNKVIKYINTHKLTERLEDLEENYLKLQSSQQPPINYRPSEAEIQPAPQFPKNIPELNAVNLPEILSQPTLPVWLHKHTFKQHTEAVASLAMSADGHLLASASWDQTLKIWDLSSGRLLDSVEAHSQGLLTLSFTGNHSLATGSFDQTIKLWSLNADSHRLKLQKTLTAHTGSIHALAVNLDEHVLVSGSYDQTIKQWNLQNGEMLASSLDNLGAVYAIALEPNFKIIAGAGGDGTITLWELHTGKSLGKLGGNVSSVGTLTLSPDGQILAGGCADGTVKLWQFDPNQFQAKVSSSPVRIITAHRGQVHSLGFSPDGQFLYSSGSDGEIKVWHPKSREALTSLVFVEDVTAEKSIGVLSLCLSNDGRYLAAGGGDGTIKIWQC